jgi:hypothetical protein
MSVEVMGFGITVASTESIQIPVRINFVLVVFFSGKCQNLSSTFHHVIAGLYLVLLFL